MGIMQFVIHEIIANIKLKSIYNPGLGAVVLLHIPVGVTYIRYITIHRLASGGTWAAGMIYTITATDFILVFLTYVAFSDRNAKWVFASKELKRFNVEEKLARKGIEIKVNDPNGTLARVEKLKHRMAERRTHTG